jgi:hypothetical protein
VLAGRYDVDPGQAGTQIYAYVAAGDGGVQVANVTDPRSPKKVGEFMPGAKIWDVVATGGRVYAVGQTQEERGKFYVIHAGDPANLRLVAETDLDYTPRKLVVDGEYAYVATDGHGVQVVHLPATGKPVKVSSYETSMEVTSFDIRESYAYVVDGQMGMRVLDLSKDNQVKEVGLFDRLEAARHVAISGEYAYVADGPGGLRVLKVANPAKPEDVTQLKGTGEARFVYLHGNYAYIAAAYGGLWIVDVSNPAAPVLVNQVDLGCEANWLGMYRDDYVFVACKGAGLVSLWVSDPKNPTRMSTYEAYIDVKAVTVVEHYALLSLGEAGMVVLDISHPENMVETTSYPSSWAVFDVDVHNWIAFLTGAGTGAQIVDLSNLSEPVVLGMYEDEGLSGQMIQARWVPPDQKKDKPGHYIVYLAAGPQGFRVLKSDQEAYLRQLAVYETPGTAPFGLIYNNIVLRTEALFGGFSRLLSEIGLGSLANIVAEFGNIITGFAVGLAKVFGTDWPQTGLSDKASWTVWYVVFDLFFVGGLGLLIWIAFFAQQVLPVSSLRERYLATRQLLATLTGRHSLAVRIRDGRVLGDGSPARRKKAGWGVAVVDLSSAVVLQKRRRPRPLLRRMLQRIPGFRKPKPSTTFGVDSQGRPLPQARVEGPGLVFTDHRDSMGGPVYEEFLLGAMDLRNQLRLNLDVRTATQDGIEVKTHVISVFTLGEKPDVVQVAYADGDETAKNLFVVHLEECADRDCWEGEPGTSKWKRGKRVKDLIDELDEGDKLEIHEMVQAMRRGRSLPKPVNSVDTSNGGPYILDRERVFAALASRARHDEDEQPIEWTELPPLVATDIFRSMLTDEKYDQLYLPADPERYPIEKLKSNFRAKVRNKGVLAYQFMERVDGDPITKGQILFDHQIKQTPARDLNTPKVLRARGIRVLFSGFTELVPVDPEVQKRLLEAWSSRWERQTVVEMADYDLRARRALFKARVQAQQDIIYAFAKIFQQYKNSKEALALRVFQALEAAIADPLAREMVPRDTVLMFRTLHKWLLSDGDDELDELRG